MSARNQETTFTDENSSPYDIIIIGAGLAGLSSGLRLQSYGARVAIIERLDRVGGLCGTYNNDGHEMVVACNDFGIGMEKILGQLGVEINFAKPKTKVVYQRKYYSLPPDFKTLLMLMSHPVDLVRYFFALRRAWKDVNSDVNLETLVDTAVSNRKIRDLLKLPAYLMGVAPNELLVRTLHHELVFEYGYWQPTTPIGGPQAMVDAMATKFSLRGDIFLSSEYLETKHCGNNKIVITNRLSLATRYIINTVPQFNSYPAKLKMGLPITTYELIVDMNFLYPENVHTIIHYPPGVSDWFSELEAGIMPSTFGFHVFQSDLPNNVNHLTMKIFFYLPRNMGEPTKYVAQAIDSYIFSELEKILPGITDNIIKKQFISPNKFLDLHGMSSRVTPVITPSTFHKPGNYDPVLDHYLAGSSVYPPGDHAGAAVLSGVMTADQLGKKILNEMST